MTRREIADRQPAWVCQPCGMLYGDGHGRFATFHESSCEVCSKDAVSVTDPRKYGWLSPAWLRHPGVDR